MEKINKAYSTMVVKAIDEDKRIIRGIASTPSTDRSGDVLVPKGAKFSLPMPFLWQHDHNAPIGNVISAKVTDKGIEVEVQLSKVDAPSQLAARLEEAWQSIKAGLVRGLSVGFRPVKYSYIDGGDGIEFAEWDWYELSAVTIPANSEGTITQVKQFSEQQAALGNTAAANKPAIGLKSVSIKSKPNEVTTMNYQEMIKRLEATKAEKLEARDSIQKSVSEDGRTKDAAEREQFDTLNDEVKAIDLELKDLKDLEAQNVKTAKPVAGTQEAAQSGSYSGIVIKQAPEKLEKGIEFARFASVLGAARGNLEVARNISEKRYPNMDRLNHVFKAAVSAGTTTDADFASKLVEYSDMSNDFIEFLRPKTIVGQFGQGGVPALRSIPFNVSIKGQSAGSTAGWVGEGKHKPVTSGKYNSVNLGFAKIAAISVASDELLRFSSPSAERLIRDDLAEAVIAQMDGSFIKIGNAAISGVRPASVINGINSGVLPTGTASPEADIAALWETADTNNFDVSSAVYITRPSIARKLAGMMNAMDNPRFPEMTPSGGRIGGVPVIVSNHVEANTFVLAFANEIWLADDGVVTLDASREASIIMDSDPQALVDSVDNTAVFAPQAVNMFQTNNIAFRAERYINWQLRRAGATSAVSTASWA